MNGILHIFDVTKQMASRDWVHGFLKRHSDLSLRQSTATGLGRAMGFNEVQVKRYFNNLEDVITKYQFPSSRIYNMDETGVSTVPYKIKKSY